jgi:gluconolactonase
MVDSYWANENCRPSVYRWDPSGRLDLVVTEEQIPDPNGILFSPEYKELYVISTGKGLGDTGPGGKGEISVFDVGSDNKLSNQKLFTDCVVDGVKCGPDGMRADVDGSLWVSSNAGRAVGYNGATCGILLASSSGASESLRSSATFMAGSQSLYALYTSTQGAAPG